MKGKNEYSKEVLVCTSKKEKHEDNYVLILHNDDINTFDFVIKQLISECNHNEIQAEQCALITHLKGQCDVLLGDKLELKQVKDKLVQSGLCVTLESQIIC